jgi:hypothetical protein
VNLWSDVSMVAGEPRIALLRDMHGLGVARLIFHLLDVVDDDAALVRLVDDIEAAGVGSLAGRRDATSHA